MILLKPSHRFTLKEFFKARVKFSDLKDCVTIFYLVNIGKKIEVYIKEVVS
jgi:hypothetical protein